MTVMFTATAHKPCKHKHGWYATIRFLIFKRRIFLCSDCGEVRYVSMKGRT